MKYGPEIILSAILSFIALLGAAFAVDDAFRAHMWITFFVLAGFTILLMRNTSFGPQLPVDTSTNIARYALVTADRLVADFLCDFLHDDVTADIDPLISVGFRRTGSTGLAAGSAEIQLNLISKHHLQLPAVA